MLLTWTSLKCWTSKKIEFPKISSNALSDALLESRFQNFVPKLHEARFLLNAQSVGFRSTLGCAWCCLRGQTFWEEDIFAAYRSPWQSMICKDPVDSERLWKRSRARNSRFKKALKKPRQVARIRLFELSLYQGLWYNSKRIVCTVTTHDRPQWMVLFIILDIQCLGVNEYYSLYVLTVLQLAGILSQVLVCCL